MNATIEIEKYRCWTLCCIKILPGHLRYFLKSPSKKFEYPLEITVVSMAPTPGCQEKDQLEGAWKEEYDVLHMGAAQLTHCDPPQYIPPVETATKAPLAAQLAFQLSLQLAVQLAVQLRVQLPGNEGPWDGGPNGDTG